MDAKHTNSRRHITPAKKAAERIGLPYTSLRKAAFDGLIPVVRFGRSWYFEDADLDRLVDKLKENAAA